MKCELCGQETKRRTMLKAKEKLLSKTIRMVLNAVLYAKKGKTEKDHEVNLTSGD